MQVGISDKRAWLYCVFFKARWHSKTRLPQYFVKPMGVCGHCCYCCMETKPQGLAMLGRCSPAKLHLQPLVRFLIEIFIKVIVWSHKPIDLTCILPCPMMLSYKTVLQYWKQDIDIETIHRSYSSYSSFPGLICTGRKCVSCAWPSYTVYALWSFGEGWVLVLYQIEEILHILSFLKAFVIK